jgi:signal transduction histidine kinase
MVETTLEPASPSHADPLATRWLGPLAVGTIAVVVGLSLQAHPSPALHGDGLAGSIALLVLVASFATLMRRPRGRLTPELALGAMIAASASLVWIQGGGPGVAGLFIAAGYAASRLPTRSGLAMLAFAVVAFALAGAHAGRSLAVIAASALGIVAFYVIAAFARRVQEAHEQTKQLLAEVEASRRSQEEAAALRERSRIARELHDVLAHSLSGLMLQLEGARMLATMPDANGRLPAALDRAHQFARVGLEEARRAVGALRDDDLPGADRLQQLAADFSRDASVEATVEVTGTPRRLDSETSLTLFRVAQEALTNSRRHARPQRVRLRLDYRPDGTRLVVEDHDNAEVRARDAYVAGESQGGGDPPGYGLTGMRERAALLGGELHAAPTSDGFRVVLWIPR